MSHPKVAAVGRLLPARVEIIPDIDRGALGLGVFHQRKGAIKEMQELLFGLSLSEPSLEFAMVGTASDASK